MEDEAQRTAERYKRLGDECIRRALQEKPHPDCDSSCIYNCTEGGQHAPSCDPMRNRSEFPTPSDWVATIFVSVIVGITIGLEIAERLGP